MKVLTTLDLLAGIQFIDYWDAKFFFADSKACNSLDDWNVDVALGDWEANVLPNDSGADLLLGDWEAEDSFWKRDTFTN
jgi:hypothetical protein